ncbi:MAG: ATP-binding cassette domain-containing protein, partial [Nitrososphaeraceae archaeon]
GPTGSGKTTVLNVICGLVKPDSGSIVVDGIDITALPIESRRIGYTIQNPTLFPHQNVDENIFFGVAKKKSGKIEIDVEIKKLLDDLGISHLTNRRIQGLSGGEMQKVSLARMLVTKPKIILMDEPFSHLDIPTKRMLRLELRRILRRQAVPTIYVTHFEDDVYSLADSVSLLQNGMIKYTDRLESMLIRRQNNNPTFGFLSNTLSSIQGNYLEGNVINSKGGLTTFNVGSHLLEALGDYSVGSKIGILVRPEDIILSREVVKTSARNLVKAKVAKITSYDVGIVDVHMIVDAFQITSRITEEARADISISQGDDIYAIFKASSPQVVREE